MYLHTDKKTLLADLLGHDCPAMPCGGLGNCGKCKVIARGDLSPLSPEERRRLTEEEQRQHVRLACRTYVTGDAAVEVPVTQAPAVLTDGMLPDLPLHPLTGERVCTGIAVDLGTTTLAAYLYRLPEGRLLCTRALPNPQARFGADVLSRIRHADAGGRKELQQLITGQLRALAEDYAPARWVITGNTTMLHLLTGLDPHSLAVSPFTPASLFGEDRGAAYLPRCISAFLGADLTTAMLACGMLRDRASLLMDLGTNGELALRFGDRLLCTSTAAGPCFEGAGISCGMPALPGAISHVRLAGGRVYYETIGNAPPVGLCGSGLIDAAAAIRLLGLANKHGALQKDFRIGDSGVSVTPADLRALQLAKAAIRAGLDTLLAAGGAAYGDIDRLYLAGGFGQNLLPESAARIGLIPPALLPRVHPVGNAAGTGARMLLLNRDCRAEADNLADAAEPVELADDPSFAGRYLAAMEF